MRIFYILMLLLVLSSSVLRITGVNRRTIPGQKTLALQTGVIRGGGAAARVLVFHQEDEKLGACEDLVITGAGEAIY